MTPPSAVEIIAHRGASFDAPENTLASFQLGWEQKADAIELDIYMTRDGQIVVIHDESTKRTTGIDCLVCDQTLEELRAQDAGGWKGARWSGEKIPTLSEVLAKVPLSGRTFIEIKCGPEILPELQRVLEASGMKAEQLVIIGFGYETVCEARKMMPDLTVCWLVSARTGATRILSAEELIARAKEAGLGGLDLDFRFPIDSAFVSNVKAAGLKLYVWTVDNQSVAGRLAGAGVDGITTNRPGWLRQRLAVARRKP